MLEEIWKPVLDYEDFYEVSSLGKVRNLKTLRVLKPGTNSGGYLTVVLSNGKKEGGGQYYVHRLLAASFFGQSSMQVNHIDMNRKNNSIENIEYVTPRENVWHSKRHKSKTPGAIFWKKMGYWQVKLDIDGVTLRAGAFDNYYEAKLAHQRLMKFFGVENRYAK